MRTATHTRRLKRRSHVVHVWRMCETRGRWIVSCVDFIELQTLVEGISIHLKNLVASRTRKATHPRRLKGHMRVIRIQHRCLTWYNCTYQESTEVAHKKRGIDARIGSAAAILRNSRPSFRRVIHTLSHNSFAAFDLLFIPNFGYHPA